MYLTVSGAHNPELGKAGQDKNPWFFKLIKK